MDEEPHLSAIVCRMQDVNLSVLHPDGLRGWVYHCFPRDPFSYRTSGSVRLDPTFWHLHNNVEHITVPEKVRLDP